MGALFVTLILIERLRSDTYIRGPSHASETFRVKSLFGAEKLVNRDFSENDPIKNCLSLRT